MRIHLPRMGSGQKGKEPTQIGFILICGSIVVIIKKHGYNSKALHFLKQHLGSPTC